MVVIDWQVIWGGLAGCDVAEVAPLRQPAFAARTEQRFWLL